MDYSRTELLWVMGEWDEALELGRGVIELGERYAYERLAFRTWVIVLPMAAARGDRAMAEHWERWWAACGRPLPVDAVTVCARDARAPLPSGSLRQRAGRSFLPSTT